MEPLDADSLPVGALILVDSAPIIYTLEARSPFADRYVRLFERHAKGEVELAVTTVSLAEVLCGPLKAGEEALARRFRKTLESWRLVELDADIAESAARMRGMYGLKLPDAIQLASALAINADALVTHDRDFSRVHGLPVLT